MREVIKSLAEKGIYEITFVDVGAKDKPEFISELISITNLIGFEPNETEFSILKKRYENIGFKSVKIIDKALSSQTGSSDFFITKHASMSSMLEPDLENYKKHFGNYSEFCNWKDNISVVSKQNIKTTTGDTVFENQKIDFLKLDTQGTELIILQGFEKLLKEGKILIIKTEVSIQGIYKGQVLFSELDLFLRNYNYEFVDFITYRNNNTGMFSQTKRHEHHGPCGDAIYILNEKTESEENKLRKGLLLHWLGYNSLSFFYTPNEIDFSSIRNVNYIKPIKRLALLFTPPIFISLLKRVYRYLKKD